MNLHQQYLNQASNMSLEALRTGYYLIIGVSRIDTASGKQKAFASAYWNPYEPNFENCLAVRINLAALGNRLSVGPKEINYQDLAYKVIKIESNELHPSQIEGFNPTYKIVWKIATDYQQWPTPTFFLTREIEEKWAVGESFGQEAQSELEYELLAEQEEQQALIDYYLCEAAEVEEDTLHLPFYVAEQEDQDLIEPPDDWDGADDILDSDPE